MVDRRDGAVRSHRRGAGCGNRPDAHAVHRNTRRGSPLRPERDIVEDVIAGKMSYRRLLIAARVLGRRFAAMDQPGEAIGLMLPNANGVAVAFLALQSAGRVAAMINYTAGPANVAAAVRLATMRTVISSRAFAEGRSRRGRRGDRRGRRPDRLDGGSPRRHHAGGEGAGGAHLAVADGAARGKPAGRAALHVGLGGPAQRGRAVSPQHPRQCPAGRGAVDADAARQASQRAPGVPFVRAHGGHGAATADRGQAVPLPVAAALQADPGGRRQGQAPPSWSAPTPSSTAMHGRPRTAISRACALSWPAPRR